MPAFEIEDGVLVAYSGSEETAVIPQGVTAIGKDAFKGNVTLKHVRIPDTMQEIGARAFSDCVCLEEAEIPGSVRAVAAYAFMRCGSLKNVTLNEGLREIGMWAFGDCDELKSIAVPSTVREIGQFALGFDQSSYEDRYIRGIPHRFRHGFQIHDDSCEAVIKYVAQHKLSLRLVRG